MVEKISSAAEIAAAFLSRRAVAQKLATLHPLVQAEIRRDVASRARVVAERGKTSFEWSAFCTQMNANVVLYRLRAERFGRAIPSDHAERNRQLAEVAAAAGMTLAGVALPVEAAANPGILPVQRDSAESGCQGPSEAGNASGGHGDAGNRVAEKSRGAA